MITTIQFKTLDDLFQFYNNRLFEGKLPECIVNMSRKGGSYGFSLQTDGKGIQCKRKSSMKSVSIRILWIDRIKNGIRL